MKIKAILLSGQIFSNAQEAHNLYADQRFGEKEDDKIIYMLTEALYLVNQKKLEVLDNKLKKLNTEELLKKLIKLDKDILINYAVFKDLRKKGYTVKSGLKFGAIFRVYDKNKKITTSHSKWLCYPTLENNKITWHEFSAKNRVAHSTKKNLLIAVVDSENKPSYYEIAWKKIV